MFVYALLFSVVLLLFQGVRVQPDQLVRWDALGSVAYLGLLGSTVSCLLWNYAIHRLGSVQATTCIYPESPVTMAVAATTLSDSITWIALLGAVLIIDGLFLTKLKQAGALGIISSWITPAQPWRDAGAPHSRCSCRRRLQ